MDAADFRAQRERVRAAAHGRWTEILVALGVDRTILNRRNQPCPVCGAGVDRFQYTDKFGNGDFHCRHCGHGDGFKLLQACRGWDFATAFMRVAEQVGGAVTLNASRRKAPSSEKLKKLARKIWEQAQPVTPNDEVGRYLASRGLAMAAYPSVLRCHPKLGYYVPDGQGRSKHVRDYPAMLAAIQDRDGQIVTLHRTYLENGRKVLGRDSKKVLSAGIQGCAVRLFEATEELAVAEGVETALAVHLATGKPVWAALSAGNLERLWIPETVRHLCIYADNDAQSAYDGQASAFALARRLKKEEKPAAAREVRVFVPRNAGDDWADVWLARLSRQQGG